MNTPSPETPIDTTPLPEANPKEASPSTAPSKTKRCHGGRWFSLGLGLGLITSIILLYVPQLLPNSLPFITSQPSPSEQAALPPIPSPPIIDSQAAEALRTQMQQVQQQLANIPHLQQNIQDLSQSLQQVQHTQQQIRAAQSSVELMQLHSRLSWIVHPASHLPQIRLAWEEIVLLPSLSPAQHQQASKMLALAQKRSEDMAHWQQALHRLLKAYTLPTSKPRNLLADWLPHSGSFAPLSQWLIQTFNIHPIAHTSNAQRLAEQQQLQGMQQQLAEEAWPDPRAWAALRSRLQLQALQQPKQQTLTLPEDFTPIQNDLNLLRQTARQWLQESQHED